MTSYLFFYAVNIICNVWCVTGELAGDWGGMSFLHRALLREEGTRGHLAGAVSWAGPHVLVGQVIVLEHACTAEQPLSCFLLLWA